MTKQERLQKIQALKNRLDVLQTGTTRKTRVEGLLARLDTITKKKVETKERRAEVNTLVAKHPKLKEILSKLGDARKENARRFKQVDKIFHKETEALRSELAAVSQTGTDFTEAKARTILARIEEVESNLADNLQTFDTNDALLEAEIASVRQEVTKIEIPDVSGIQTAQEGVQSLSKALEELEKRVNRRLAEVAQRGGGNANRQVLVNGSQSTLGTFTDINLIPGSNMGIAVSVDQTNKRTNFTLSAEQGGGTISSVVGGTGIYVDNTDPNTPIVNLGNASVVSGSYGSSTLVPTFTVDQQGRLSAASNVGIAFPVVPAGVTSVVAGGGIEVGNADPSAPIVERSSIVGDISIPQGSVIATLPNVNTDVGTFGDSTTVSRMTVNAKGQITAASSVGIAFPAATTPAGDNTQIQYNDNGAFGASSALAWDNEGSVLSAPALSSSSLVSGVQARFTGAGTFGTASLVTSNNTRLFVDGSITLGTDDWFRGLNSSGNAIGMMSLDQATGDVLLSSNANTAFKFMRAGSIELARINTTGGNFGVGTDSPTSRLHVGASFALPINTQTSVYTLNANDHTLLANASVAGFTVNLPNATTISGRVYAIKKIDVTANAVTVDGNGTQTIDGTVTASIVTQYQSLVIQSDGANWHVLSSHK